MERKRIRKMIRVYGIVQGIGFRPFVSRIAAGGGITGSVCNKGSYVEIFAEGQEEQIRYFEQRLRNDAPERALILKISSVEKPIRGDKEFRIIESEKEGGDVFVSPDIATCPKCRKELFDPSDRRYLHPFINCTACGPRLTILDSMPYDRERTSMVDFPMCPECEKEYRDPRTRRYHAQPICCNDCGPELYTIDRKYSGNIALMLVRDVIRSGGIAAIKGIGGFHLACNGADQDAVMRLRKLKKRPFKPFALMMRNMDVVNRECIVLDGQEEILNGPQKPILLLEKRGRSIADRGGSGPQVCPAVSPHNPNVGVMLPYTPIHMLLFDFPDGRPMPDTLVMTSGNLSGAPICRTDEDAERWLAPLTDVILTHDREIRLRADDSVMDWMNGKPYMIRRSRGYAPLPFMKTEDIPHKVLGIGGELKNTFCLASGDLYYTSPYIGDLADYRSVLALKEALERMKRLLEITPELVVCDLHPGYNSSRVADELGIPVLRIQHHYAHVLSCMVENDCAEPVIGVSFDGTGYGTDGTIWGGEFLIADAEGFRRAGSIAPFPQAGGDAAAKEGWRIACSLLLEIYGKNPFLPDGSLADSGKIIRRLRLCSREELSALYDMIRSGLNCVTSTSCGRLFDGVSAVLGLRRESTCEGEASMVLEFAAEEYERERKRSSEDWLGAACIQAGGQFRFPEETMMDSMVLCSAGTEPFRLNWDVMLRDLTERRLKGEDTGMLAYAFHVFLSRSILQGCRICRRQEGLNTVCLTGGVMQNRLLVRLTKESLENEGFEVLTHSLLPPNDGGIGPGQAFAGMVMLNQKRQR